MRELDRAPLEGGLNTNPFYLVDGVVALARVSKQNKDLMENIDYEYRTLGFMSDGGRVRRRSADEQRRFSHDAAMNGLMVLPPIDSRDKVVTFPFLDHAQPLNDFFNDGAIDESRKDIITYQIFEDLKKAHKKDFVYGDRWAGNMLVHPKLGLVHIDFDLELSGPSARELEVAQVLYHVLWSRGDRTNNLLKNFTAHHLDWCDPDKVQKYLKGFSHFLKDTHVGGIDETVNEFITTVDMQRRIKTPMGIQ